MDDIQVFIKTDADHLQYIETIYSPLKSNELYVSTKMFAYDEGNRNPWSFGGKEWYTSELRKGKSCHNVAEIDHSHGISQLYWIIAVIPAN